MIYLDNQATTSCDPRVLAKMLPYFCEIYGNASSAHFAGVEAHNAVGDARGAVATLLGCRADEIIFTSGATESINLALKAAATDAGHVITAATEHRAVLDTCAHLASAGMSVSVLPVGTDGLLSPEDVSRALRPNTRLVSIMHGNNEIGVIQPISEIGAVCREAGVLFHTDASQTLGKVPIDVDRDHVDLLSGTAHKIYGPKGVGFLFCRRRALPALRKHPLLHGGGHEGGVRSGTLNVPGIVGLGEAARLASVEMIEDGMHTSDLAKRLILGFQCRLPEAQLNGHPSKRVPGSVNLLIPGVNSQALLEFASGVYLSTGSACSSHRVDPSHVLLAIGRTPDDAFCSIRMGIGRFNTQSEIDTAIEVLTDAALTLQALV